MLDQTVNLRARARRIGRLSLLSAAVLLAACSSQRKAEASTGDDAATQSPTVFTFVTLSQGACFGTCPVFTMTVAAGGATDYDGKQFAPYRGLHHGRMSADTLARLRALVQQVLAKAERLPREIDTGIMDYSQTKLTIATATDTITFTGTTEFAEGIDPVIDLLKRSIDRISFTRDPAAEPLPPSQLRLVLQAADQIQVVQEDYFKQRFKVVRTLSNEPASFLVSFDPYTMSAEEMIASLKQNELVVSAEVYEGD